MELNSQRLRQLSPEVDPLRIGTGWKPEDLGKVQVFIESTFGDSHPGIWIAWWKKHARECGMPADTVRVISARTCATAKVRDMMASTIHWSAGK